ncbi:MAG: TolB-like 6-bladed beta-propeller domain-containing protein [Tannerella sp.]|jgi:hypothetical protein|nr:TolB-like 6-bladed beta-propeller domain-containing protein [Tannerella sp.]
MTASVAVPLGFVFILSSCSDSSGSWFTGGNWFAEKPVKIKNFKQEKRLTGKLLLDDFYGYNRIVSVDEYLVVFSTKRENLFFVYSADGDSLGAFGTRGQVPNELISPQWCGQSDGTNILINDVNRNRICAVDIKESLSRGTCLFSKTIESPGSSVNSFVRDESTLVSEQIRGDGYYLIKTNLNTKEKSEEKLYKYPVSDVFSIYKSNWRMKPDGSKMASAMQSINMINILDLRDNGRISLIVNPPVISLGDIVDVKNGIEKRTYYSGIEVTDNYIYALYKNQAYEDIIGQVKKRWKYTYSTGTANRCTNTLSPNMSIS